MEIAAINLCLDQGKFHYECSACGHSWNFVFPNTRHVAKIMCICGTFHHYTFTHSQEKEK